MIKMSEYKDILTLCKQHWKEKKYSELIEYAQPLAKDFPKMPHGKKDIVISEILLLLAMSFKEEESKDNDLALDFAFKSAIFDRESEAVQWLIRQIKNEVSERNKYFKIEVEGEIKGNAKGEEVTDVFHTLYGVVAETSEEALELIVEFENPAIRDTIKLFNSEEVRREPKLPKGIYKTSQIIVINRE